jgi:hypothetical protein
MPSTSVAAAMTSVVTAIPLAPVTVNSPSRQACVRGARIEHEAHAEQVVQPSPCRIAQHASKHEPKAGLGQGQVEGKVERQSGHAHQGVARQLRKDVDATGEAADAR